MFPQVNHPQLNALIQAAAGSVFKGAEMQRANDIKKEKTKEQQLRTLQAEQDEETKKTGNASNEGHLA